MLMDQIDTLYVGRYPSEVLCCTITADQGDLEVKATDFKFLCLSFYKSISLEYVDGSSS